MVTWARSRRRTSAIGLILESAEERAKPMSYAADSAAPPVPAAMVPASIGAELRRALVGGEEAWASLNIADMNLQEDASGGGGGVDEGTMAQVVALEDGLDESLALELNRLQERSSS